MAENRGRPSEKPAVALDQWIQETEDQIWYFDRNKSANGPWKVENWEVKAGEPNNLNLKSTNVCMLKICLQ